jgi:hypothetical protein
VGLRIKIGDENRLGMTDADGRLRIELDGRHPCLLSIRARKPTFCSRPVRQPKKRNEPNPNRLPNRDSPEFRFRTPKNQTHPEPPATSRPLPGISLWGGIAGDATAG